VEDIKVGEVVRTVRRRRGLRQRDVAAMAGVSQWSVSAVERGQLEQLTLCTIRRVCSALEIGTPLAPRWRGVELPRLLDARHAALVEEVVARLSALGWETVLEYTFQHFGERGSVDVLAWRPEARALLVVEVKTDLDDLQEMLSAIDRKARLVPRPGPRRSPRPALGRCPSAAVPRRPPGAGHRLGRSPAHRVCPPEIEPGAVARLWQL
jgi:transcriptional regulator with XRE-family HTH domain